MNRNTRRVSAVLLLSLVLGCGRTPVEDEPMPMTALLPPKGLRTYTNSLVPNPRGNLARADDIEINRTDGAEPRRGFPVLGGTFGEEPSDRMSKLYFFRGVLLGHYAGALARFDPDSLEWTDYGMGGFIDPATNVRLPGLEANLSFYVSTSAGVKVLDDPGPDGVWRPAGVPRAIDSTATRIPGVGTALPQNAQAGFRHLWARRDFNGRLKEGVPSPRVLIVNPGPSTVAAGDLSRSGATVTAETPTAHGFEVGDVLTLSPGEADFAANTYTVASVADSTHFTYTDAGSTTTNGTPQVFTNSAVNVTYVVHIPASIDDTYFLQTYRTRASGSADADPGDDEQLANEYFPTAVDLANGYVTIIDRAPDAALGVTIYTSSNLPGGGFQQANFLPPVSMAMANFNGSTFFGATQTVVGLQMNLLAEASPQTGEQIFLAHVGSMITVYTLTAGSSESSHVFKVFTDGTVAQNIENTCKSIVRTINDIGGTDLEAFYQSGPDDPPGQFVVTTQTPAALGVDALYIYTSVAGNPDYWSPALPNVDAVAPLIRTTDSVTATTARVHSYVVGQTVTLFDRDGTDTDFPGGAKTITAVLSPTSFTYDEAGPDGTAPHNYTVSNLGGFDVNGIPTNTSAVPSFLRNGVSWSKTNDPDSVPLFNNTVLGNAGSSVLAMLPLRDSLFVFKEDGLWRGSGSGGRFVFEAYDRTIKLLCGQCVATLGNQIYALTDQGVAVISEQGSPRIVSFDISDLLPASDNAAGDLAAGAWAVSQESKHEFRLSLPNLAEGPEPVEQLVYNAFTESWVRHVITQTAGAVDPVLDHLWMASGEENRVTRDLRSATPYLNHYDWTLPVVSITAVSGKVVTLSFEEPEDEEEEEESEPDEPTIADVMVGDVLVSQSGLVGVVDSIDLMNSQVTLHAEMSASVVNAPATLYRMPEAVIQYLPVTDPNPGFLKQFQDVTLLFRGAAFDTGSMNFKTDFSDFSTANTIPFNAPAPVHLLATPAQVTVPFWPPLDARMATQFSPRVTLPNALGQWVLEGIKLNYIVLSQQTRR